MQICEIALHKEFKGELYNVLNYSFLKKSPTLSKFLEYIVAETIQGRSQNIKEYNIAVNALKRPSGFNCNDDAIVRIHAGRLRRALNLYYVTEGKNNEFFIHIPKGSYVPHLERQVQSDNSKNYSYLLPNDTNANPIVAIFPFKSSSDREEEILFSRVLSEDLSSELSRFRDISTIGYHSLELTPKISENIIEAGKLLAADYIITGSVQFTDGRVKIRVNLLMASNGEVMLTKTINKRIESGMLEIQDEIVNNFIGAIGGYYGLIFHGMNIAAPLKASANKILRDGIYGYYKYQRSFSVFNFKTAVTVLEKTVKSHPHSSETLAMLGEIYLSGILLDIRTVDEPFEAACKYCAQALKIDPLSQHAWQTITLLYLFKKDTESCLHAAMQCLELNRNCTVITCNVGFVLVCAGYFKEGFPLMKNGADLSPDYPWFVNGGLCFYFIYKKEYTIALYWAEKMNAGETYWDPLLKAVCFYYMGKEQQAKENMNRLLKLLPDAPAKVKLIIPSLILSETLATHILAALQNIGLDY
ncbi:hypothetical protein [Flavobacterium sp. LAR06]|uniref:hypothetical protein n=1 Tax=Flavobacterium sp. LAR06 TaxID=3064897 RepID=UPI0035BFD7E0